VLSVAVRASRCVHESGAYSISSSSHLSDLHSYSHSRAYCASLNMGSIYKPLYTTHAP
jgi:hypothetical protein